MLKKMESIFEKKRKKKLAVARRENFHATMAEKIKKNVKRISLRQ